MASGRVHGRLWGWKRGGSERSENQGSTTALGRLSAGYFVTTLILGGAGTDYPLIAALIQLGAVVLLWRTLALAYPRLLPDRDPLVAAMLLLLLLLPVLHLIPLPPEIWTALPGRELPAQILRSSGAEVGWRPMSLDPEATVATALELLPGLAMFFAVVHLRREDRLRLVYVILASAALSALLGTLQKASGAAAAVTPFPSAHRMNAPGLFVNRNHQATFLLVAIILGAAALRPKRGSATAGSRLLLGAGLLFLYSAGVVATASRMGLVLLPLALLMALLVAGAVRMPRKWVGLAAAGAAAAFALLLQNSSVRAGLSRFSNTPDPRFGYWADLMPATAEYWPVGSGLGTFRRVFPRVENLNDLLDRFVYNAHNDYLEVILEAGAPAALLLLLFLLFLVRSGVRLFRSTRSQHLPYLGWPVLAAIVVIMLHSAVDYPLRMMSVMAAFGLLCGLLHVSAAARQGKAR